MVADADAAALADTFLNTIDDDPRFWDYSGGNYELQRDSPCKWTGYELDGYYLDFNGDLFHDPPSRGALEAHRDSPGDDDSSDISSSKIRLMAHPNPFGPETALRFTLPTSGPIRLTVHDPAGRLVTTVAEGHCTAGEREMKWDGSNATGQQLPSGVYFARLIAPGGTAFRKLILVR